MLKITPKTTLYVRFQRVSDFHKKLKAGKSLTEEEVEELSLHLGITKFRNREDMLKRIEQFIFMVKKIFPKINLTI